MATEKQHNPEILRVLLDGFVEDYEAMEAHVTKADKHRVELMERINKLESLLRQGLDSHFNGNGEIPHALRNKFQEALKTGTSNGQE